MSSSQHSNGRRGRIPRFISFTIVLTVAALAIAALMFAAESGLASAERNQSERTNPRISERQHSMSSPSRSAKSEMFGPLAPVGSITVDRTDDFPAASACTAAANDCSLRGAVSFANLNPGTTINIPAGTYNLTISGATEFFTGNNLIGDLDITGNNTAIVGAGAASTIIHQTTTGDRVIEVNPFLDANFVTSISDVTISGGHENTGVGGGGIISGSVGNALTLTNCVITGNSATGAGSFGGGGVSHTGGSLTISGCTFSGNSTSASGGGVGFSAGDVLGRFPSPGTLSITGSTFTGNSANSSSAGGGAVDGFDFNASASVYTISSSSFSGNNATNGSGGAMILESGGPLTVTTSSFANNTASTAAGAIYSSGSLVTVRYSRLTGNTSGIALNGLTFFRNSGLFTADDNWWGSNAGPLPNDFRQGSGSITTTSYLQLQASANPSSLCTGASATIDANIKKRNVGSDLTVELNGLPAFPATFINGTPAVGSLSGASTDFVNGAASASFTASSSGTAQIDVTADNQTVTASVQIEGNSTSDPSDVATCEGGTATFSTSASGPGPFSFVWKKGTTVLNNGDLGGRVNISSSDNSSTLTISTVQAGDADTYTVEATGACSTASQSASLAVNSATSTTDPPDQTVCQGATANFATTASGTGPFSYAWTLDGSPFDGDNSSISIPTGSLSVGNHSVSVTVTGACGAASQTATLTVQESTSTTDPADQTVCQGATANFSTTASGTGPFSYAWKLDGSPFGGDTSSIAVSTGSLSVGNHTVEVTVTGACGSSSQSATLTVQETTSTTDPADQAVCQGATANFSTTASGTGPFHYAWTVDGSPAGGDSASLSVATGSLSIGNHNVSVTVTGTCGTASQTATLTVQETTSTSDPADQSVCEGATANFSTTASGTGPFHYAWTVDGNPYNGDSPSISINTTGYSQGAHTVAVTTTGTCGSASQTATLTVNNSPPTINVANSAISVWPPNHQYQNFTLSDFGVTASSSCDGDLTNSVVIASVTSDELDDNVGGADGNTVNDIVIAADCKSVRLRRERDGSLDGRVYTITFRVTDSVGHTTTATARVTVPLNQGGGGAVDSGPHNTVNGNCP